MVVYNKVIYGDETLIDLTTDTVTANKILDGYTAHDASGAKITGNCQYDANTKDATAVASEIIAGKSAYVKGVKIDGTMINVGSQTGSISTKTQTVSISQGYHDGSGTVSIDSTEQVKIIADNIKKDVTILGVTGTFSGGISDGIVTEYPGSDLAKVDIYYSRNISSFSMPACYNKSAISQIIFHPTGSGVIRKFSNDCFRNCSSLVSIDIPSSVTSLSTCCFYGCSSLVSIDIPSSVTSLGNSCFRNCSSLVSIDIPSGVTSLGIACFFDCTSLTEIHFRATAPATVGSIAWNHVPTTCKIYVPIGSLSAYTSSANYPSASTYTYIEE